MLEALNHHPEFQQLCQTANWQEAQAFALAFAQGFSATPIPAVP